MKKNKHLLICENNEFIVDLEEYPETGHKWILDNVFDLKNYGIEPKNLEDSNKGHFVKNLTNGGVTTFKFFFSNTTLEELPSLKFVYRNELNSEEKEEEEICAQVNLLMDKEKKECGRLREYISYKNDNVEETLEVESQNLYHILIDGEILNDKTLSTGHTWYLENKDEVEANGLVELIETFSDISYDAR